MGFAVRSMVGRGRRGFEYLLERSQVRLDLPVGELPDHCQHYASHRTERYDEVLAYPGGRGVGFRGEGHLPASVQWQRSAGPVADQAIDALLGDRDPQRDAHTERPGHDPSIRRVGELLDSHDVAEEPGQIGEVAIEAVHLVDRAADPDLTGDRAARPHRPPWPPHFCTTWGMWSPEAGAGSITDSGAIGRLR